MIFTETVNTHSLFTGLLPFEVSSFYTALFNSLRLSAKSGTISDDDNATKGRK